MGRSGTSYIASFYKNIGLDMHHDNGRDCKASKQCPGGDGAVSWPQTFSNEPFPIEVSSSSSSKYHRRGRGYDHHEKKERACKLIGFTWKPKGVTFDYMIHLVRDPIKTIDSRWDKVCMYISCVHVILC